jgi:diacylglycerol kinase (ATP)
VTHLGLVVNPTAGKGRGTQAGRHAHELLRARGHTVEDLSASTLARATDRARAAAVRGLDALVVVGGDGMVHLGVNVVAGTGLPLGIVAAGTGNDIARSLALPRGDVAASVAAVERGLADGPRGVDAARVGPPEHAAHEWFVGVLSCGFDAAINARANEMTWPQGAGRYVRALLAELGTFQPYGYRVTLDDSVWESPGSLVAIANTAWFGGGFQIAPDARVDDGLLDVVVAGPFTRAGILKIFPGIPRGKHIDHPSVDVVRTRSVLIEPFTDLGPVPPVAFADGERIGPLPLRVTVEPGALSVLG